MKIGDKYYCIEDNSSLELVKDKWYVLEANGYTYFSGELNHKNTFLFIYETYEAVLYYWEINEYFLTEKEFRIKQRKEKLNEIERRL